MLKFRPVQVLMLLLLFGGQSVWAAEEERPPFKEWLADVIKEAIEVKGINPDLVEKAFKDVEPVERIVQRDRKQAEFVLTYDTYLSRVAKPETINGGKANYAKYRAELEAVAKKYGVQPRFILAHWAIETRYGKVRGTMPVIPALATLAWDRRRSKFFRTQLFDALTMLDKGYIDLERMKGSWAGAMGQPQFIPSSYLAYAQDFDGDGYRDIWQTEIDVFASIANYLAQHGWSDDQTWGREVSVPSGFASKLEEMKRTKRSGCRAIDKMTVSKPLSEWQDAGVRRADGRDLPVRDLQASLVMPDGAEGRAFLVYRNYHSILRYNCAHHYGLTVGFLADQIGNL